MSEDIKTSKLRLKKIEVDKTKEKKPKTPAQQKAFEKMVQAKTEYWDKRKVITANKKELKKKIKEQPYVDEEEQMLLQMLGKIRGQNANKINLQEIEQIGVNVGRANEKEEIYEDEPSTPEPDVESESDSEEIIYQKRPKKIKKQRIVYVSSSEEESEEKIKYVKKSKPIVEKRPVQKVVLPVKSKYKIPEEREEYMEPIIKPPTSSAYNQVRKDVQYKPENKLRIPQSTNPEGRTNQMNQQNNYNQQYQQQPYQQPMQKPLNSAFRDSHYTNQNDGSVFGM